MAQVIVFLALAFSIVIAIFAVQNTMPVTVQFLTLHVDSVAVSVLVLISAALGAAAMLLLGLAREVGLRWRHRAVSQELKATRARVSELETTQSLAVPTTPGLSSSSAATVPIAADDRPA